MRCGICKGVNALTSHFGMEIEGLNKDDLLIFGAFYLEEFW